MTALEIANMLNISEDDAQEFIETCDAFDGRLYACYDDEALDEFDALVEEAEWDFDYPDLDD